MNEIVSIIGVQSVNNDIEKFTCKVFTVLDDNSYLEDFPDRKETFRVSRTLHNKLFNFLMDKGMKKGVKISFDFIKEELKKDAEDNNEVQK